MADTSVDDIGIPLRVRQPWKSDHCKNLGQVLPVLKLGEFAEDTEAAEI